VVFQETKKPHTFAKSLEKENEIFSFKYVYVHDESPKEKRGGCCAYKKSKSINLPDRLPDRNRAVFFLIFI
jgi:hypothetical protein